MTAHSITPVILCGGSGSRLWPLSRMTHPKQFLSLHGPDTLFQEAVGRLNLLHSKDSELKPAVIATGEQLSVRTFLDMSAKELGVTLRFEGEGVSEVAIVDKKTGDMAPKIKVGDTIARVDPRYFRPTEVETLLGDASRANKELGWVPEIKVTQLCREMVANDLDEARQMALLKEHGYKVNTNIE